MKTVAHQASTLFLVQAAHFFRCPKLSRAIHYELLDFGISSLLQWELWHVPSRSPALDLISLPGPSTPIVHTKCKKPSSRIAEDSETMKCELVFVLLLLDRLSRSIFPLVSPDGRWGGCARSLRALPSGNACMTYVLVAKLKDFTGCPWWSKGRMPSQQGSCFCQLLKAIASIKNKRAFAVFLLSRQYLCGRMQLMQLMPGRRNA